MEKSKDSLTYRQRRFAAVYAGNGVQAARRAGFRGTGDTLAVTASDLLRNPKVLRAIRAKEETELGRCIADSNEVKSLWSDIMRNERMAPDTRLRAGELLEKARGGFVEKHEHSGPKGSRLALDLSGYSLPMLLKLAGIKDVPVNGHQGNGPNGHTNGHAR